MASYFGFGGGSQSAQKPTEEDGSLVENGQRGDLKKVLASKSERSLPVQPTRPGQRRSSPRNMTGKIPSIGSAGLAKESQPSVFFPQEISTEIALQQSQGLSNQRPKEKTPKTSKVEPDTKNQRRDTSSEINPIREKTLILEY